MNKIQNKITWDEKNSIEQSKNLENNPTFVQKDIISETKKNVTKNEWNDITIPKISGIYKIINKINGKYYVGSAINFAKRWREHRRKLNKNIHHNLHLQSAWNKYGEVNFLFEIVEKINEKITGKFNKKLIELEQKYLNLANEERLLGIDNYNISYDAKSIMLGKNHTTDTLLKMSKSKLGNKNPFFNKKHNDVTKQNISYIMRNKNLCGNKNPWHGQGHKQIGENNANYNKTIFNFSNIKTNEKFVGTKYQMRKIHNLNQTNLDKLIRNKIKHYKGWVVINNEVV
jgi:group I intron endonuclease